MTSVNDPMSPNKLTSKGRLETLPQQDTGVQSRRVSLRPNNEANKVPPVDTQCFSRRSDNPLTFAKLAVCYVSQPLTSESTSIAFTLKQRTDSLADSHVFNSDKWGTRRAIGFGGV